MGKNYKRKASLIVCALILIVLGVFPLVSKLFNLNNDVNVLAVREDDVSNGYYYAVGSNALNLTYAPGTYMFIMAGQNGVSLAATYTVNMYGNVTHGEKLSRQSTGKNGLGAACLGFFRTVSTQTKTQYIGKGGEEIKSGYGTGSFSYGEIKNVQYPQNARLGGGGYTSAYLNFALPTGTTEGEFKAAGGGGAGVVSNDNTSTSPLGVANSNEYSHGRFLGLDDPNPNSFYGNPGKSYQDGTQGKVGVNQGQISPLGKLNSDYYSHSGRNGYGYGGSVNAYYGGGKKQANGTIQGFYNSGNGGAGEYKGGGGGEDPDFYTAFPGGGGVCSSNGYPLKTADSEYTEYTLGLTNNKQGYYGDGYFEAYRIDPVGFPSQKPGTGAGSVQAEIVEPSLEENDRYSPSGVFGTGAGINTSWVYSFDINAPASSWKELDDFYFDLYSKPKGQYNVYCKYVIYATPGTTDRIGPSYHMKYTSAGEAAKDASYTISSSSFSVVCVDSPTINSLPTANNDLTYQNKSLVLINPGSVTNGTIWYKLSSDIKTTAWSTDYTTINATEPGSYTVHYYVKGANSSYADMGSTSSPLNSLSVKIDKVDPGLSPGTLSPIHGLVYDGIGKKLFEGSAMVTNPFLTGKYVDRRYYVTPSIGFTDDFERIRPGKDVAGTGDMDSIWWTDALHFDGMTSIVYYFWYSVLEGSHNKGVGWTLLTDDKGVPITNQIQPVTLTVTADIEDEDYDGNSHQLVKNINISSNSPSQQKYFKIKYYETRTFVDDTLIRERDSEDYIFGVITAGKYDYYATWEVTNLGRSYNYIKQTVPFHLGTGYLNQIGNTRSNIGIAGLPGVNDIRIDTTQSIVQPFYDKEIKVDIIVCDSVTNNLITSQEQFEDAQVSNDINLLAFALSHSIDPNDVSDFDWHTSSSAADLNEQIKNIGVSEGGMWYLHFKVIRHFNLKTDTAFYSEVYFNIPTRLTANELTGIYMNGDSVNGDDKTKQITYDGKEYDVCAFGSLRTTDEVGITLSNVKYALNTSLVSSPQEGEWKSSVSDLARVTHVAKYYLWVKWDTNIQVTGLALVYGSFEIKQRDVTKDNWLYFSGADFSEWAQFEVESINGYKVYEQKFRNQDISFGTMNNPTATVQLDNTQIYKEQFGNLTFNYGTEVGPYDDNFVPAAEFSSLAIKKAGRYCIWVKWSSKQNPFTNNNIQPGQAIYKTYDSSWPVKHIFIILPLSDERDVDLIQLGGTDFVQNISTDKKSPYKYLFDNKDGTCVTEGQPQPLFALKPGVNFEILIDGQSYNYSGRPLKYLLSKSTNSSEITVNHTGWSDSLNTAQATDIGRYYLWCKIAINDDNVQVEKVFILDDCWAEIVATESPICDLPGCTDHEPTAVKGDNGDDLVTNGEYQVLINPGNQMNPCLEYSMDGGITWTTNYLEIKAKESGTYTIYYRGANYTDADGNLIFKAVDKPLENYEGYLDIIIQRANIKIQKPVSLNVVYNGEPQVTFSAGKGFYLEETEIDLIYSWEQYGEYHSYDEFTSSRNKFNKTDVGRYTLWVDNAYTEIGNEVFKSGQPISVTVEILKADIQLSLMTTSEGNFVYQGADYQLLAYDVNYVIMNAGSAISVDGVDLTYANYVRNLDSWPAGRMGKISYAVTNSKDIPPDANAEWKDSCENVVARNAGNYYIWVKVEAGDFHNGIDATCYNPNAPIIIAKLEQKTNDNKYQNVIADNSSYVANTDLYYKGISQVLINSVNLQIAVAARNNQGDVVLKNGEIANEISTNDDVEYNPVAISELGEIYYALIIPGSNLPDEYSDAWLLGWDNIGQLNAGTYHLAVMIKGDNFAESIKFNLSLVIANADEIEIMPAVKDSLQISGINKLDKVYTADAQVIATGNLVVKIDGNDVTLDVSKVQYAYGAPAADTSTLTWANSLDESKVTEVGQYQLYLKLQQVSGNISQVKPLIYSVFAENRYASIVPVGLTGVSIVKPNVVEGLTYNGLYQKLLSSHAVLKMKDGKTITGTVGEVTYYISGSFTPYTANGTTKAGEALKLNEVQELNAGTYYIYAAFAKGTNHDVIDKQFVVSVTIAKAGAQNIALSGIEFTKEYTYNGTNRPLIKTPVSQTLIDTGRTIEDKDYLKIEYAYSTDPETQPSSNAVWVTDIKQLVARDVESYYVWVRVTGKPNIVNNTNNIANYTKCYYVNEQDYAEIHRGDISRVNLGGVSLHEGLVYTAQNQVLASIPDAVTITFESNSINLNTPKYNKDIVIYWALGESKEDIPTSGWVYNIKDLQGKASGDYHLYIWVQESKNIKACKCYYSSVTINKGTIEFVQEPGVNTGLTYLGDNQILLSHGSIAKFVADGEYYGNAKKYFDDNLNEIVIEYSLDNETWTVDYNEIKGLDAREYTVYFRVTEAENWYAQQGTITVNIDAIDASTEYIAVVEAPTALTDLHYNEEAQDLISFGVLSSSLPVAGCGAALEGTRIVFYYADDSKNKYEYYFDVETQQYVWDEGTGKLPGKTVVGTYTINYYISASTTGNYYQSQVFSINISIAKRQVYWEMKPESYMSIRHTGEMQRIIIPGQLNVGITDPTAHAKGVEVLYTMQDPALGNATWTDEIPTANTLGLFFVWYYVQCDENNEFIGAESTPDKAVKLLILIEPNTLKIVDAPRPLSLNYSAGEQSLVNYYYLTSDNTDAYGDKAPYMEYTLDPSDNQSWVRDIKKMDVGTYKIYYRVQYIKELFDFDGNDGHDGSLFITSEIVATRFSTDSVQAEFVMGEDGSHNVTYKVATYQVYNEETGENEDVPLYSSKLMKEVSDYITYYYRKNDEYHVNKNWEIWTNGVSKLTDLANYEFKLEIVAPETPQEDEKINFVTYEQEGIGASYLRYTYCQNRTLKIIMEDYNTPAYVRYWIDFDGNMKYEDNTTYFKNESYVGRNGTLEYTFTFVYSNGYKKNGQYVGQIRLDTPSTNTFYYVSDRALTYDERRSIKLDSQKLNNGAKGFNIGLFNETTTVYLYEVYHIQYDNNYGIGDSLTDGWKWHGIEYRLEENKYQKLMNGVYLEPNGWNTSRSGNGNNYNGASMVYRENASQIFYAKFFSQDEKFYTIKWVIDDGVNQYALSRDFTVWFDALNPSYENRTTGTLVLEGDLITLPQVETDEFGESLAEIFGGYVIGWHTADDDTPYTIGMTAVRDMTFIAELNSDVQDYVNCVFVDAENKTVHNSGKIASGSEAYMALSGMDANLIKSYQDGFNQWVEKYGYDYLDRKDATNGVFTYQLGAKTVDDTITTNPNSRNNDLTPMIIVLVFGTIPVVACLVVYLYMRKKQLHQAQNQ